MMADISRRVDSVVLPGDILHSVEAKGEGVSGAEIFKLGPGVREDGNVLIAYKAGILRHRKPSLYWIDTNQKRYVPVKDENVIGIILNKGGESYKVDIGSSLPATLGNLSFEGATKRNRAMLQIGDIVYCKLAIANKDMEPEITCVDANGKSNGLGPLCNGFMMQSSLGLVRKLLAPDCLVIRLLGKEFPFEVTVGMNGRIWIKSKNIISTIAVANAVSSSEFMDDSQVKKMVADVVAGLRGF